MHLSDLARYGLWCGIAATAEGNRRQYAMMTTWLPHLATNTLSLLLPDLLRAVMPGAPAARGGWRLLQDTVAVMVRDNRGYVLYVAPLAAGYLLSAPWLNIYKGELGVRRLAGFGLDALPHAATAFALTAFVCDGLRVAARMSSPHDRLGVLVRRLACRRARVSAAALALATLLWEAGEYDIHRHELALRGDAESINMQWSVRDTLSDCAANAIGWLLAVALKSENSPGRWELGDGS